MGEADLSGDHGACGGARHQGVGAAFEDLVEHGRAAGDEGDADERQGGLKLEGVDAGAEIAEVESGGGGDEDHERDAEFEQNGVGGEQRRHRQGLSWVRERVWRDCRVGHDLV